MSCSRTAASHDTGAAVARSSSLVGFSINEFNGAGINCTSDVAGKTQTVDGLDWVHVTLATETTFWYYWQSVIALGALTFGFFTIGYFLMKRIKTHT